MKELRKQRSWKENPIYPSWRGCSRAQRASWFRFRSCRRACTTRCSRGSCPHGRGPSQPRGLVWRHRRREGTSCIPPPVEQIMENVTKKRTQICQYENGTKIKSSISLSFNLFRKSLSNCFTNTRTKYGAFYLPLYTNGSYCLF